MSHGFRDVGLYSTLRMFAAVFVDVKAFWKNCDGGFLDSRNPRLLETAHASGCSNLTIRGTYAFTLHGTIFLPDGSTLAD
jgi:hypothetical protein